MEHLLGDVALCGTDLFFDVSHRLVDVEVVVPDDAKLFHAFDRHGFATCQLTKEHLGEVVQSLHGNSQRTLHARVERCTLRVIHHLLDGKRRHCSDRDTQHAGRSAEGFCKAVHDLRRLHKRQHVVLVLHLEEYGLAITEQAWHNKVLVLCGFGFWNLPCETAKFHSLQQLHAGVVAHGVFDHTAQLVGVRVKHVAHRATQGAFHARV